MELPLLGQSSGAFMHGLQHREQQRKPAFVLCYYHHYHHYGTVVKSVDTGARGVNIVIAY